MKTLSYVSTTPANKRSTLNSVKNLKIFLIQTTEIIKAQQKKESREF